MFEPFIVELPWGGKFFLASEQAARWYNPVDKPLQVELDWISNNVNLGAGRKVIDAGCHHGLYSVVMGKNGAEIHAADLHLRNLDIAYINCSMNKIKAYLGHAAITNERGWMRCHDAPLGSVEAGGPDQVPSVKLSDICPNPHVVKLDIEGCEFLVLPEALDELPTVDTWIVEIHPWWFPASGNKDLFTPFVEHGFELSWIDRSKGDQAKVEPLDGEVEWKMQSTLLAVKR